MSHPPVRVPPPNQAPPSLTPAQMIEGKFAILTNYNELIAAPLPEPELSAFKSMRDTTKRWLASEITSLTATPAQAAAFWKDLWTFGASKVIGMIVGRTIGGIAGKIGGPVTGILLSPGQIGGVETQIVDSMGGQTPSGQCYRITWYRTRWADELIWGPIQYKIEEVPC